MDYNSNEASFLGVLLTICLWIWSKLFFALGAVTIANIASVATIISATLASIAIAPKAWKVIKELLKPKNNA